jgi:hypothetical protein
MYMNLHGVMLDEYRLPCFPRDDDRAAACAEAQLGNEG